jgi:cytochrome c oxidase assembly protein subunit 11
MPAARNNQRKHIAALLVVVVGMFGFAFALVPLYDVFCELTGLNGKTSGRAVVSEPRALEAGANPIAEVSDREVTIQFLARVGRGMPWEFRPTETRLRVRPGQMTTTNFYVRNRAGRAVTGQAVPSVSPGLAALHLHKTECFCFTQQTLEAGQDMEMPVTFYIDDDLPDDIGTLSLSYTLFKVEPAKVEPAKVEPTRTAHLVHES